MQKETSCRLTERAPAKINTFLAVTGRREDGYHTLIGHMQAVSLADVLELEFFENESDQFDITLSCHDPAVPTGGANLIVRAAQSYAVALQARGRSLGGHLTVRLEKRIPMAAGLAGGSADAAATLRGINQLCGNPLTMEELCGLGVKLGADIPFCLRCGMDGASAAMTARGIGEVLESEKSLPFQTYLVIACAGDGVSTPWAYRQLDARQDGGILMNTKQNYAAFSNALAQKDLFEIGALSYNCFEAVVLPARPVAKELMQTMKNNGAVFCRMSGSGPAIVGFFAEKDQAEHCAWQLEKQNVFACVCQPCRI